MGKDVIGWHNLLIGFHFLRDLRVLFSPADLRGYITQIYADVNSLYCELFCDHLRDLRALFSPEGKRGYITQIYADVTL